MAVGYAVSLRSPSVRHLSLGDDCYVLALSGDIARVSLVFC